MEKEDTIIYYLANGYTQPEIALKLEISLSNVEKSLKAMRKEHGAKTMFQLGYLLGIKN
jgi:DNA-binding NarL/FixJ family response regulator